MDNEPQPIDHEVSDLLSRLRDPVLITSIEIMEAGIESISKTPQANKYLYAYKNRAETLINWYFQDAPEEMPFTISGYVYCADHEGTLYLDSNGRAAQGLADIDGLDYDGALVLRLPYGSSEDLVYKVMCQFHKATDKGDGTLRQDTYFISPGDILNISESEPVTQDDGDLEVYEYSYESNQLKHALIRHADNAEAIIKSPAYHNAAATERGAMLRLSAQAAEQDVIATYSDDTIEVETSEFFIVNESGISFVDQVNKPSNHWNIPVGEVVGCDFIDLIQQTPASDLSEPIRLYPSIILSNYKTGSLYYIPIRAFIGATSLESKDDYDND